MYAEKYTNMPGLTGLSSAALHKFLEQPLLMRMQPSPFLAKIIKAWRSAHSPQHAGLHHISESGRRADNILPDGPSIYFSVTTVTPSSPSP